MTIADQYNKWKETTLKKSLDKFKERRERFETSSGIELPRIGLPDSSLTSYPMGSAVDTVPAVRRQGAHVAADIYPSTSASTGSASAQGGVSVIISTPYMDEASRCHRVGFMKNGRIIAEDTPSNLRGLLNGRILELRGSPINVLRHIARKDQDVEDVQAFGDRLHIRVGEDKAQDVLSRLKSEIRSAGGQVDELRLVPPGLEDVFIALSESSHE